MHDPFYKKAKQVHCTRQAGVMCYGMEFKYKNEYWSFSTMPPVFAELLAIAQRHTGELFDTVLLKIYAPGESLAKHKDIDGSPLKVACFTFVSDPTQVCDLVWHKGSSSRVVKMKLTPDACSMWFMGGSTNSEFTHRVPPAKNASPGGLRVSVTFRQSTELQRRAGGDAKV
jgi:alkylated DNA repair dioxygenase AlkB